MRPAAGVCVAAFASRLRNTCSSRSGSPCTAGRSAGNVELRSIRCAGGTRGASRPAAPTRVKIHRLLVQASWPASAASGPPGRAISRCRNSVSSCSASMAGAIGRGEPVLDRFERAAQVGHRRTQLVGDVADHLLPQPLGLGEPRRHAVERAAPAPRVRRRPGPRPGRRVAGLHAMRGGGQRRHRSEDSPRDARTPAARR